MLTSYTDGACRGGNPGFCSAAWVLYEVYKEVASGAKYLGPERHTNNYAEYQALLMLLRELHKHGVRGVHIFTDSELVLNQTLGNWTINKEELRGYAAEAYGMLVQGCHILRHVDGHSGVQGNERADELCNQVLDEHKDEYEKALA